MTGRMLQNLRSWTRNGTAGIFTSVKILQSCSDFKLEVSGHLAITSNFQTGMSLYVSVDFYVDAACFMQSTMLGVWGTITLLMSKSLPVSGLICAI